MVSQACKERLLDHLVSSGALVFTPTRLKSGRISPYYISMRKAVSTGRGLQLVADSYVEAIVEDLGSEVDYLHGPAYAGIPLASAIAERLWTLKESDLRYGYDRKEEKDYGLGGESLVVGDLRNGDRVLLIDDVLTTGGTKLEAVEKLAKSAKNLELRGVLVAVDRQEKDENGRSSREVLVEHGLKLYSILKVEEVFSMLHRRKIGDVVPVSDLEMKKFREYFDSYGAK